MRMTAVIDPTGTTALDMEGDTSTETYASVMEARRSIMTAAKHLAAETSTNTELHIEDPAGIRTILVHPDGQIVEPATNDASAEHETHPAQQELHLAQQTEPAAAATEKTPVVAPEAHQLEEVAAPEPVTKPAAKSVATPAPKRSSRRTSTPAPAPAPAEVMEAGPAVTKTSSSAVAVLEAPTDTSTHTDVDVERDTTPAPPESSVPVEQVKVEPVEAEPVEVAPMRRTSMPSFVDRPDTAAPAQLGVRGLLNHFGFTLAPSKDELAQREDELVVSRHWAGPRTIAVLNPKGGAGCTPTEICLSAVFARLGGSGVLAWDNNNSLGSLGWRTYDAGHEATVVDLLEQTDYFMTAEARVGDLAAYVHRQPADQYDVLRSDDRSGATARHEVTGAEVHRLHAVAAKYYRLILMDTGNTERGDNWEAMISHTDQVVIPVKSVDDAAEGASRVLSALRAGDEHAQALADRAVVIILGGTPAQGKAKLDKLADDFRPFVKAVATVPYDPSLVEGRIRFSAMLPGTRRAWLRAAALIAGEL